MSTPQQMALIPDEPPTTELKRIAVSAIPESQTATSRQPSAQLVHSIERYGVLSAVWVAPLTQEDTRRTNGEVRYRLLAGRRRILGARIAGVLFVNAVVFPYGTTQAEALALIENELRSENPLVALEQIESLISKGADMGAICEAVGMDKRRAEATMRLANLIPELREAIVKNLMAVGVAEEAARLTESQQRQLWETAKERQGQIRGKDVTEAKRVKAAHTAAGLPSALFGGDNRVSAPTVDEDGPEALPVTSSGLLIALPSRSAIRTIPEAREYVKALTQYVSGISAGERLRDACNAATEAFRVLAELLEQVSQEETEETAAPTEPGELPPGYTTDPETGKPILKKTLQKREQRARKRAGNNQGEEDL